VEIWEFLRGNLLSHRAWETYDDILEARRDAWNKLLRMPDRIASITMPSVGQICKTGPRIGPLV
jgi:hypothetical protein